MSLVNIAKAGMFSADRAVKEYAERIWKKETRLVSSTAYRPGLGHWDDSSYRQLDVPYCSHCKKETSCGGDFCPKCGAYFKK